MSQEGKSTLSAKGIEAGAVVKVKEKARVKIFPNGASVRTVSR
jgi:hypothetical protein